MTSSFTPEFLKYLDSLILATEEGKVSWARANPTTFVWDKAPPNPGRLVLQKVDSQPRMVVRPGGGAPAISVNTHYVFQAVNAMNAQASITINGAEETEANEKLAVLYQTISTGITRTAVDFLKSMLP